MTTDTERSRLLQERVRLRQRLEAIKRDYRSGLSADSEEQALELENREVLDEIARTTQLQLDGIEEALSRLDAATPD